MKILITGYNGFIGKNLFLELSKDHQVYGFDWNDTYPKVLNFDHVIHLGAITSTTETNVEKVMIQNYDFSVKLLKDCIYHEVPFQYASSASVYGVNNITFKEDDELQPVTPYAWSKYLFDRYVKTQKVGRVQGFRYFNVYGPHEDHKGSQASPYHQFKVQKETTGVIRLFEGSENFKRDFVPVSTVIDIHKKFLDIPESGIWNVGTGSCKSFLDVALEFDCPIVYTEFPKELSASYQKYTCANLTKLDSTLAKYNLPLEV